MDYKTAKESNTNKPRNLKLKISSLFELRDLKFGIFQFWDNFKNSKYTSKPRTTMLNVNTLEFLQLRVKRFEYSTNNNKKKRTEITELSAKRFKIA